VISDIATIIVVNNLILFGLKSNPLLFENE